MTAKPSKWQLYLGTTIVIIAVAGLRYVIAGGRIPLGTPATPASLLSTEDQAVRAKLAPVVACINGTLPHFEGVAPAFQDTARILGSPARLGIRPAPTYNGNLFKVTLWDKDGGQSLTCAAGLDKAASMPPRQEELDQTASKIANLLRSMIQPGAAWDGYIDQRTYLDDGFATGRTLVATLSPMLSDLVVQSRRIETLVEAEDGAIRTRQLTAIEKRDGQTQRWHIERTMIAARALLTQTADHIRADTADAAAIQAAIDPLQAAHDEGVSYAAAHPGDSPDLKTWRNLEPYVTDELRDAKELRRTLADPSLEREADRRTRTTTLLRTVNAEFDQLVEAYNRDIPTSP